MRLSSRVAAYWCVLVGLLSQAGFLWGAELTLDWQDRSDDEAGFRVERSADGVQFAEIAIVGSNTSTYTDRSVLPAKEYWYRVRAYNEDGNSGFSNVARVVLSDNVPEYESGNASSLAGMDVGSPWQSGITVFDPFSGLIVIQANGVDIGGGSDQFHFAQQRVAGDVDLVVRVDFITPTNAWAKAGLMIRSSPGENDAHASVFLTPGNGVVMQWRDSSGAQSQRIAGPLAGAPIWLRLSRSGTTFAAYHSANGADWREIRSVQIAMPESAHLGLAVTSHSPTHVASAIFSNFYFEAFGSPMALPATLPFDDGVFLPVSTPAFDIEGSSPPFPRIRRTNRRGRFSAMSALSSE